MTATAASPRIYLIERGKLDLQPDPEVVCLPGLLRMLFVADILNGRVKPALVDGFGELPQAARIDGS